MGIAEQGAGRDDGAMAEGIRTTDGGWAGRWSRGRGCGFAELTVAGRGDGGVGEDSHN